MIDHEKFLSGALDLVRPPIRRLRRLRQELSGYSHTREVVDTANRIARRRQVVDAARLKQDAFDYAGDVFGRRSWGAQLYLYAAVRGRFEPGWIPENFFHSVINKPALVGLSQAKTISQRLFGNSAFPDIAYVDDRILWTTEWEPRAERDAIELIFSQSERVVFKPNSGLCGLGIRHFDRTSLDKGILSSLPDGVFQAFVEQHDDLSAFGSPSAATLRIITVMHGGQPEYRAAYLRLGRGQDKHVMSDSSVRVNLGPEGQLSAEGYLPDWSTTDRHPDSGVMFAGLVMPQFSRSVGLTLDLHRRCPFFSSIGWDVCVNRSGQPKIFEFNINHDIKFVEATQGPCFRGLGWEAHR